MNINILKFGGSSVANTENISKVITIIKSKKPERLAVVVSALGGVTDMLQSAAITAAAKDPDYRELLKNITLRHTETIAGLFTEGVSETVQNSVAKELEHLETLLDGCYLLGELSPRTKDLILSFGEVLSSCIIVHALIAEGEDCTYSDSRKLIKTNNHFGRAVVNFEISNLLIQHYFDKNKSRITVLPGFIAESEDGHITTLGRGGSDFTAAILAAALDAEQLEIWTDVSGIYTANPKLVKQAKAISHITFEEAMELSHFGAKVLYPPTIQPIVSKGISLLIKNTFEPEAPGSIVTRSVERSSNPVKGISNIDNISLVTLEGPGMIGVSGFSKRLFEVISKENVNVIFITQASSEHSICFGILDIEAPKAKMAIDSEFRFEISQQKIKPAILEKGLSVIAIVGENMKSHQGLSGKMFSTLGRNNVNVRAIAQGASERNISAVIDSRDVKKALNSLHETFFEDNTVQLNLFVMGVGNVGDKFLEQIQQQRKYLKDNLKINVKVIGLANSKKMYFDEEGIPLKERAVLLEKGEPTSHEGFLAAIKKLNLRNSIFVDNTASDSVAMTYADYLKQNIAVVTCNKVACSSDYSHYYELKSLSRQYNAPFLFETNVGAGLPIIDTLKNIVASGDRIHKIKAVLSGSLNFIFNNFNENVSFYDIVRQAQAEGYTEPDPKIDLSGIDVKRKLVILIRESGYKMEIDEIGNNSFLPEECLATTNVDAFFESLKTHASHFDNLYKEAVSKDSRLKFVATFEDGEAYVGLEFIPKDHPFYNLEGKDNIVLFHTDRYVDQPLIIKGAGAGAAVTASGIFADVIRIGNIN